MDKRFTAAVIVLLTMVLCMPAVQAAVGIYETSAGPVIPSRLSYLLNKNAEHVRIEVIPVDSSGNPVGSVLRWWDFDKDTPQTLKGMHIYSNDPAINNSVMWDGKKQDGTPAPYSSYLFRIIATGAPSTDLTKLTPVWESVDAAGADNGWRVHDICVNKNPNSRFYGRIYVSNNIKASTSPNHDRGVYEFLADGTLKSILPNFYNMSLNAPWGIAIDQDDHIYVTDRSRRTIYRYSYDTTTDAWVLDTGPISYSSYTNNLACYGKGDDLKLAAAESYNALGAGASKISTAQGDPPVTIYTTVAMNDDTFCQAVMDSRGNIYIAGVQSYGAGTGSVSRWPFACPPSTIPSFRNNNLSRAIGVGITSDEQYIWVARMATVTNYSDPRDNGDASGKLFVKLPLANFEVANPYTTDGAATFYGFGTAYSGVNKAPGYISAGPDGNIAVVGGQSSHSTQGYFFGVYEQPSETPTTTVADVQISPYCCMPLVIASNTITPGTVLAGSETSAVVEVVVRDPCGDPGNIKMVRFHCPEIGYGVAGDYNSGKPMTVASSNGVDVTFKLPIIIPAALKIGRYTYCTIAYTMNGCGAPAIDCKNFTVMGGILAGRIINGATNTPAANVKVRATLGSYFQETTTGSDGSYSFDVNAGTGYSIAPVLSSYGVTSPQEYNLQSDWPSTPGNTDWPKTADAVAGNISAVADGHVYPLGVLQVTYDWTAGKYRIDGPRTVCVEGIVIRQPAHPAIGLTGLDNHYYIGDSRYQSVLQTLKVNARADDPVVKEGDKVVVIGHYNVPSGYNTTYLSPSSPVVVTATGQVYAAPKQLRNYSRLYDGLIGEYYTFAAPVVSNDIANNKFTVRLPKSATDQTVMDVNVIVSNPNTTLISIPYVGCLVRIVGICEEIGPSNSERVVKPGKREDVDIYSPIPSLERAKKTHDTNVDINLTGIQQPLLVTYVDPGEIDPANPRQWFWVECPNRTVGLKVISNGFCPATLTPGATVKRLVGTLATPDDAARELLLEQAPEYNPNITTSPTPAALPQWPFVAVIGRGFGGSAFGYTPGVADGIGLNTDGILMRIAGTAQDYGSDDNYEWFWLYDGSRMRKKGPLVGIKVIRSRKLSDPDVAFPTQNGKKVVVEGISTSENVAGVGRVRVLHIRYDGAGLSDKVQTLK